MKRKVKNTVKQEGLKGNYSTDREEEEEEEQKENGEIKTSKVWKKMSPCEVEPYLSSISKMFQAKTSEQYREMVEGYLVRSGSVTFLVDVVVPAVVVVDVVSVSSSEKVSASLHGSASSPHCLRKIVRNTLSAFPTRLAD